MSKLNNIWTSIQNILDQKRGVLSFFCILMHKIIWKLIHGISHTINFDYVTPLVCIHRLATIHAAKKESVKVKIYQCNGIGDHILNAPYINYIKEKYSIQNKDIIVIARDNAKDFYDYFYKNIRVETYNKNKFDMNIFYRINILRKFSKIHSNYSICTQKWKDLREIMLLLCTSKSDNIYIHSSPDNLEYENKILRNIFAKKHAKLINISNNEYMHESIRIYNFYQKTPFAIEEIQFLRKESIHKKRKKILLNIGASDTRRRWPLEKFINVANQYSEKYDVEILCGDDEAQYFKRNICKLNTRKIYTLTIGNLPFSELEKKICESYIIITNDTAIAHLAIVYDANVIVITTCCHYGCYFPYPQGISKNTIVAMKPIKEFNCYKNHHLCNDSLPTFRCLSAISENEIMKHIDDLEKKNEKNH